MRTVTFFPMLCLTLLTSSISIRAQAPRTMSFQGFLTNSVDVPIDGPETIGVKIFDASSGGTQVWSRSYSNHPVNAGIFDILLDAGSPTFSSVSFNDSLWVQIEAGSEVISPRAPLTAAPFAMGLSLPITAEGTFLNLAGLYVINHSNSGSGILGSSTASSIGTSGVRGINTSTTGRGVTGKVFSGSGATMGVSGETSSVSGRGVSGEAFATSGINFGVRGKTRSASGWGGYFTGGQGTYTRGEGNNAPDLVLGAASDSEPSGRIFSDTAYVSSDIFIQSNDFVTIQLDRDGSGEDADFYISGKNGQWLFNLDESGALALRNAAGTVIFQVDTSGTVKVKGSIVHPSDRNRKDNIVPVNTSQILENVARLPIHQ